MNKLKLVLLATCLAVPVMAHEGHDHADAKEAGKTAAVLTVQGELVDLACYLDHGGKGEKHAKCAGACVTGGAPLGLLTKEGKLYLVVGDHADEKPFVEAKAMAGSAAKLTGKSVMNGGLQALIVSKTEKP
jgi:hypothetical protein